MFISIWHIHTCTHTHTHTHTHTFRYLKVNPLTSASGGMYVLGNPASDKAWYVGMADRNEVEKMVLAAGKCDYVIRLASDKQNYAICINQGDGT